MSATRFKNLKLSDCLRRKVEVSWTCLKKLREALLFLR